MNRSKTVATHFFHLTTDCVEQPFNVSRKQLSRASSSTFIVLILKQNTIQLTFAMSVLSLSLAAMEDTAISF
jgi:hypothetical protein